MKEERFSFAALPHNVDELSALPEAALASPYATAALAVAALCRYPESAQDAASMLDVLRGPRPMSEYDRQFLRDRFRGKAYLPFSYFEGATPENGYAPAVPYRITVADDPHSYDEAGYVKLFVRSGGADSPRPIKLRQKGDQWFLWEYSSILSGVRLPAEADPWA